MAQPQFTFKKEKKVSKPSPKPVYGSKPKPKKHYQSSPLVSEFTYNDGPYSLYASIAKDGGKIEKGILNKHVEYNAKIMIRPRGGEVASLVATYRTKNGDEKIKGIGVSNYAASFDVPCSSIVNNQLRVTVTCKFRIGFLKSKVLKTTVSLYI